MIKVGTITGNEKVQNPNMEYCIELNDGRHLFSEKGFLELFNRMKVVVNNDYKHNVKTLVCDNEWHNTQVEADGQCHHCKSEKLIKQT